MDPFVGARARGRRGAADGAPSTCPMGNELCDYLVMRGIMPGCHLAEDYFPKLTHPPGLWVFPESSVLLRKRWMSRRSNRKLARMRGRVDVLAAAIEGLDIETQKPETTRKAGGKTKFQGVVPHTPAATFLGTWSDSLGNNIEVGFASETNGKLVASFVRWSDGRAMGPFVVRRTKGVWRCGNGHLEPPGPAPNVLRWTSRTGLTSIWQRKTTPPEQRARTERGTP